VRERDVHIFVVGVVMGVVIAYRAGIT